MTSTKQQQIDKANRIDGWAITLWPIIAIIIGSLFPIFRRSPLGFIFCVVDWHMLKKQDVWKKGKIALGWCLIPPVYLYKRTKLLKESMLKFWILIIQCCVWAFISFLFIMSVPYLEESCVKKWTEYGGIGTYKAEQVCKCSVFEDESVCLKKYDVF